MGKTTTTGPQLKPLKLNPAERESLQSWARRRKSAQALAQRARAILLAADGLNNTVVAAQLGWARRTVGKWRQRFLDKGLDGLLDEPRPGTPRRVSDDEVERVITLTLESTPPDATHWSTRSMAKTCGLSHSSVQRIWKAFALQPHRSETFKLSQDPLFVEKVRDIVGLYLNPPQRALVLSVDEKSQIQALDRTQPLLPLRPGQIERRTHDYINLVERWFATLTQKQIRRGVHRSTAELERAIEDYIQLSNADSKPFVWSKTADQIFASLARFCNRTLETGH